MSEPKNKTARAETRAYTTSRWRRSTAAMPNDISVADNQALRDHFETWNTCPDCQTRWRDERPTPGLLHRTRRCVVCTVQRAVRLSANAPTLEQLVREAYDAFLNPLSPIDLRDWIKTAQQTLAAINDHKGAPK